MTEETFIQKAMQKGREMGNMKKDMDMQDRIRSEIYLTIFPEGKGSKIWFEVIFGK